MDNEEDGGPVVSLAITYVKVKVKRGDWWGGSVSTNRRHLFAMARALPPRVAASVKLVARRHLQGWLDGYGRSPAYRRSGRSAAAGFFGWLHREGRIDKNPALDLEVPDEPEAAPRRFTDDEVDRLMVECAVAKARDRLIVSLCWEEGLRCCEVSRALIEDLDLSARAMNVRGKGYRGKVSRSVALSTRTVSAINGYLTEQPARNGPLVRSELVPTLGVTPARVGRIVAGIVDRAGLKWYPGDGRSAHAGRHTSASQALEGGADDQLMMRFYGWRSNETLQRYTSASRLDLSKVVDARANRLMA